MLAHTTKGLQMGRVKAQIDNGLKPSASKKQHSTIMILCQRKKRFMVQVKKWSLSSLPNLK